MLNKLLQKIVTDKKLIPPLEFIIKILLVYGCWKLFHTYASSPSSLIHPQWASFNNWFGGKIVSVSVWVLLDLLGYKALVGDRTFILLGTQGIYIADHCLGIPPIVIFTAFIAVFSGKWYHKLWFIPMGVLGIFFINVFRVVGLGVVQVHFSQAFFNLSHTYVYLLLTYGLIFLLVTLWMNRFYKL
jgi:exosortase/archaeosortase family protein